MAEEPCCTLLYGPKAMTLLLKSILKGHVEPLG